ncbi:MAG TPA: hypothetical protein VMM82_04530 [Spirochaetia bacterium]|nr:hypothetical protein [Spirochaetia bacterium]
MKKLFLLAAAAIVIGACTTVPPAKPAPPARNESRDAVLLGEREVNFKADHDTIAVGAYEGSFRSLSFRVEKNDIELFNLVIVYGNGEKQRLETRLVFREGSRSRLITFAGGKRRIKEIQFTYKTVGTWQEGKARVVVYGVK